MTFTVRIYNDETLTGHTDHSAETEVAAYALVYNEPAPLPTTVTLVDPNQIYFDIYNDGILYYTTHRPDALGESL